MKVKRIESAGFADVYNMEVENHHNFAVNGGFIVHNCDAIRYFVAGRPRPPRIEQPKKPDPHWMFRSQQPQSNGVIDW